MISFYPGFSGKVPNSYILLVLLSFTMPQTGRTADTQSIICAGSRGAEKRISVDYANAGGKACRTIYDPGGGQLREIAWGQNSTQICSGVAYRVVHKLTQAGWRCSGNFAAAVPHVHIARHIAPKKPGAYKRKARVQYVDRAFLESIKK